MSPSAFIAAFTINVAPVKQQLGVFAPMPTEPAQPQLDDELAARDHILKALVPTLHSIQHETKFAHVGSVAGFDLLGPRVIVSSASNRCLLLLQLGHPGLDTEAVAEELRKGLPDGSDVSALGELLSLASSDS
jgi:hypothetical protein